MNKAKVFRENFACTPIKQDQGLLFINLKVQKNENYFGSDFEFCTISLSVMLIAQILRFCKQNI